MTHSEFDRITNTCFKLEPVLTWDEDYHSVTRTELEKFAQVIAMRERELCAKACESAINSDKYPTMTEIATIIRNRTDLSNNWFVDEFREIFVHSERMRIANRIRYLYQPMDGEGFTEISLRTLALSIANRIEQGEA